jgi:hypothetical protein
MPNGAKLCSSPCIAGAKREDAPPPCDALSGPQQQHDDGTACCLCCRGAASLHQFRHKLRTALRNGNSWVAQFVLMYAHAQLQVERLSHVQI